MTMTAQQKWAWLRKQLMIECNYAEHRTNGKGDPNYVQGCRAGRWDGLMMALDYMNDADCSDILLLRVPIPSDDNSPWDDVTTGANSGQEAAPKFFDPEMGNKMTGSEYQLAAARTLIDAPDFEISNDNIMLVWNAIGLAGEAGEVADSIKKAVFHQKGVDREALKKELGDVLWYVAALCTKLGLDLSDVMAANDAKLRARYPDGFDPSRSHKQGETPAEGKA